MNCRFCAAALDLVFVDLGSSPPSNAYLSADDLLRPETWYPLRVLVCRECRLVQTQDMTDAQSLFTADYAYFSGVSQTWQAHCAQYAQAMIARLALDARSRVVEIASNDGTLLLKFRQHGIPTLGVEPTASTAAAAREQGLEVVQEFFGVALARELLDRGAAADLIAANNVLAHVPDLNDFVRGIALLLKPSGVATFEFPHLAQLIAGHQFDTIYHEHFSYLSLLAVERVAAANGLQVFDVEELPTHGGSLRVFCCREEGLRRERTPAVDALLARERESGLGQDSGYAGFQLAAEKVKNEFLGFLLDARRRGLTVAGYGAAAKGNTLLNFAGVRSDLLAFVVDRNPAKQGRFLPGSRIAVLAEEALRQQRPDYIVILPWNLREEVIVQLAYAREWGARFVTAVPALALH